MKKFFKHLFGRTFVVFIAILLQTAFLIGVAIYLQHSSLVVFFVAEACAMMAVVHLINRDMLPEGKITWTVILLVIPICGIIIYALFSQNRVSRVHMRRLQKINAQTASFFNSDNTLDSQARQSLGQYFGQAHYLSVASNAQPYADNKTEYFKNGTEFWHNLLAHLQRAQRFIFLEFFIIERGEMWNAVLKILKEKVAQGVEVRVMYDDLGSVSKLPYNYHRHLKSLGINCVKFNKIVPVISAVYNNRDHRKIVVIDGNVGYVCGCNLADEYINKVKKFGVWKDSALRLNGDAVKSLTIMFLQLFDIQTKKATNTWENYLPHASDNGKQQIQTKPTSGCTGWVVPFGDGPRPLNDEMIAEQALLNIINQAQNYLYITTPYLILDERLKGALCSAAKRGVEVAIVTPDIPDKKFVFTITRYNYKPLQKAGVKIYQFTDGFMHSKSILADGEVGIVGTINLDYRSLLHHYECGIWMCRTAALAQLKTDLQEVIEQSTLQSENSLSAFQRFVAKLAMLFAPLL